MLDRLKLALIATMSLLMIAVTACTEEDDPLQPAEEAAASPTQAEATNGDDASAVELEIFEGPGGSVIVFVPVHIRGEGPFDFILDTGASRSVIDSSVIDQFDFDESDAPGDVTGIGGTADVNLVEVDDWTMGENVELPSAQVTVFEVLSGEEARMLEEQIGREVQGLIGSDVLASFGLISIDFDDGRLSVGR